MANTNIFNGFKVASEHLGQELYRRDSFRMSPITEMVPRGTFPKQVGLVKTMFDFGNILPTTDQRTWDSVTLTTGSNQGACAYNFTDYTFGWDELTYQPSRLFLRGPVLCKDDKYFEHNVDEFVDAYLEEMAKLTMLEIANKFLLEFQTLVPKAVITASVPITAAGAPLNALPAATSDLTQEALDKLAVHLFHKRAFAANSGGWVSMANGGPVYTLYIGQEASQSITTNNSDFRQDLRDADAPELLRLMGANTAIKNFRHVINPTPPRFTFSGGTYTRVNTYADVTGTKGTYQDFNPDWLDDTGSQYEAAYILNPDVFTWDWIQPSSRVSGLSWEPHNYMGEWEFITGPEAAATDGSGVDPFKKIGRHMGEIFGAAKPGRNRSAGLMIIFKRCHLASITTATCS